MKTNFFRDPYALFKYHVKMSFLLILAGIVLVKSGLREMPIMPWVWIPLVMLIAVDTAALVFIGIVGFAIYCVMTQSAHFGPSQAVLLALGVASGPFVGSILHNAVHGNFPSKPMNVLVGEAISFLQLTSFEGWKVHHLVHHQYPDDPRFDPHPPLFLSFPKFILGMKAQISQKLAFIYLNHWGDTARYERIGLASGLLYYVKIYLTAIVVVLVIGPSKFLYFFIPCFVATLLYYGHFNYITHRPSADGKFEILNLSDGWRFKILNFISFGTYFHKNHHAYPYLFNPMNLGTTSPVIENKDALLWVSNKNRLAPESV